MTTMNSMGESGSPCRRPCAWQNFPARPPVHHNSRSGRGEEYGDSFGPPRRKADEREELDEEFLRDRIECLGDIDLHEDGRAATAIKPATGELNCHEVVVNGPSPDEGALVVLDKADRRGARRVASALATSFPMLCIKYIAYFLC